VEVLGEAHRSGADGLISWLLSKGTVQAKKTQPSAENLSPLQLYKNHRP
jgi:hypothetical protein